jgi:hypothetical protein
MRNRRIRECALCSTRIYDRFVVCFAHKDDYQKYKNEEWFQELAAANYRQFEIDKMELETTDKLTPNKEESLNASTVKGRKVTKKIDLVKLKEYLRDGIPVSKIAKIFSVNRKNIYAAIKRHNLK